MRPRSRRAAGAHPEPADGTTSDTAERPPPAVGAGAQAVLRRYQRRADAPAAQDAEIHRVADLLLRVGDVLVGSGAATSDVEAAVIAAANALGVPRTEVDITFNAVTVTLVRDDGPPVTQVRVVRQRAANYDRLAAAHNLIVDLVDNGISRREAAVALSEIEAKRPDCPRWLVSIAWGVLAAAVTQVLGGTLLVATIAFGSTLLVDQIGRLMRRSGWPDFYVQVIGGFVVTLIAAGLTAANVSIRPSLVVVGGIIVLLAGLGIVSTLQDALTGFLVTAAGRAMEVVLMTAGIIAGASVALMLARQLDISMGILPPATSALVDIPGRTVAAAIGAASFAVAYQTPRRLLMPCGAIGAVSFVTWYVMQQSVGAPALSAGAAAVVVGLTAHVIALRLDAPPLVVVVPGLVLLLPGLAIYRGLLLINDGATTQTIVEGIISLGQAATIGLALAAGVLVGEIIGQPVRRELSKVERRFARPRMVGPARLRIQRRQRG